ncbi:hypothetical protein MBLNU13_g01085t1 [Cladosporium sp. NU13]
MGCCGERDRGPPEPTAKWTYINLSDFKSTSSWNTIAYIWVWIMAIVAVAVFAADTFTAVNLLAYNKWTSKVEPKIPLEYARWIFAGCIMFGFVLYIFNWIFAIRAIRRGGIADSFLDPLAATLQSMRGSGWRRFLVFSNLTQSKKGTDYIAYFVYFSFQSAIRVIIAEGPRQAINGMTLYSVMQDKLMDGDGSDKPNIVQFWANLQHLFQENNFQALTMCAMLFTLIIWVISALSLLISLILYLVFLWHYIPQQDGRLKVYCRRKIDRRLEKIVEAKIKAAMEEEEKRTRKAEKRAEQQAEISRKKTGELPPERPTKVIRQPTLPVVPITPEPGKEDKLPEHALVRQATSTTVSTLPPYSSRPPTRNENQRLESRPSQRSMHSARPMPSRNVTQSSGFPTPNYEMDAPLLDNVGYTGHEISRPPTAASRRQGSFSSIDGGMPTRTMTQGSQGSQGPQPMYAQRPNMGPPGPTRSYTPMSRTDSPGPRQPLGPQIPFASTSMPPPGDVYYNQPPPRQNTPDAYGPMRQDSNASFNRPPPISRQPTFGSVNSQETSFSRPVLHANPTSFNRPFSPPSAHTDQSLPYPAESYEMTSQPHVSQTPAPASPFTPSPPPVANSSGYTAFNPSVHSASSTPAPHQQMPQRSATAMGGHSAAVRPFDVPQRSVTAPAIDHSTPNHGVPPLDNRGTIGYSDIVDDYGRSDNSPPRAGHAGNNNWPRQY